MDDHASRTYRRIIDRLVEDTQQGQGQIGRQRVQRGVWNPHATRKSLPDQAAINEVLARPSKRDRTILAEVVASQFTAGVHQALLVLHEEAVAPFDRAYEGTPFHDYVGRLAGWQWPKGAKARRS